LGVLGSGWRLAREIQTRAAQFGRLPTICRAGVKQTFEAAQRLKYDSATHQIWAGLDGNGTVFAPVLNADTLYTPACGFVAADFLIIV
jgi:hypothetical protein